MALLPIHKYFLINDELKNIRYFDSTKNEGGIYEVLRVIDGVPLFLEDHLERFFHSSKLSGNALDFSIPEITDFLVSLIQKNKIFTGNILISCKKNLEAFFIKHVYPKDSLYEEGVVCGILKAERNNPNAKVLHTSVRHRADQILAEKKYYEVILLDHLGKITEGSRSNVFFVKGKEVITSPEGKVLLGITRQKTIQLARDLDFKVLEKEVSFTELKSFDAAFITGTSPKILPISKIDAFKFNPRNEVINQLIESYDKMISAYILQRKK